MSWENYNKNKDQAKYLKSNFEHIETSFLWQNKTYTCHCSCCEDIYEELGSVLYKRKNNCKCGSFRLSVYDTSKKGK